MQAHTLISGRFGANHLEVEMMKNPEKIMLMTALILGLSGSAGQAKTATDSVNIGKGAEQELQGKEVAQEKLEKLIKNSKKDKKHQHHFEAKAMVHEGRTYIRLPRELVKTLRGGKGSGVVATLYGLQGTEKLEIGRMQTMIKTMDNVILTVDASGANNEAILDEADRKAVKMFGAPVNKNGAIQARGFLRLEALPAGNAITIVVTDPKKSKFNILVVGGEKSNHSDENTGFSKDGKAGGKEGKFKNDNKLRESGKAIEKSLGKIGKKLQQQ